MNLEQVYAELWSHKMPEHPPDQQYLARVRWTAELFPSLPAGSRFIDLGTGSGAMLHEAVKRGWEATGFEFNDEISQWLRDRGWDVQEADLSVDPLGITGVDIATCCDVIEHLIDPAFAMRQAFESLKPGGWLFVSTPNLSCWRRVGMLASGTHARTSGDDCLRDGGHVGYYGARDLIALLEAAGFSKVEMCYRNPDPTPKALVDSLKAMGGSSSWLDFAYQIAVARK